MNLQRILRTQRQFVKARHWEQFHQPKNLVMALMVEASELAELFQWRTSDEKVPNDLKKKIADEVADVFYYLLRFCDVLKIDLEKSFEEKMRKNAKKYPVRLAKGSSKKYTELRPKKKLTRRRR